METQSEAFGFNRNVSIECSSCEYHNKYYNSVSNEANLKMYFHSHFSDDYAQNAATTFQNIKNFNHLICDHNFFIKYGIIYYTTDGCSKQ